jgi:hypothetical protein
LASGVFTIFSEFWLKIDKSNKKYPGFLRFLANFNNSFVIEKRGSEKEISGPFTKYPGLLRFLAK